LTLKLQIDHCNREEQHRLRFSARKRLVLELMSSKPSYYIRTGSIVAELKTEDESDRVKVDPFSF
jgi:hypothetical protein